MISKFYMNVDIIPIYEEFNSQYFWKQTNTNRMKNLIRLASHPKLNWVKTRAGIGYPKFVYPRVIPEPEQDLVIVMGWVGFVYEFHGYFLVGYPKSGVFGVLLLGTCEDWVISDNQG